MSKRIKKGIKKMPKKLVVLVVAFAILFGYFAPFLNVFAEPRNVTLSVSFRNDSANYGIVQYSTDGGEHWDDITGNTNNLNLSVSGDNMRLRIVPNQDYSVDYAGIGLKLDDDEYEGLANYGFESNGGYTVPSNVQEVWLNQVEFRYEPGVPVQPGASETTHVTVSVSGETLEYDMPWGDAACDFVFGINGSVRRYLDKNEVNYTRENGEIVGLETKEALEYTYNYNNEGTVTFNIKTQWDDLITALRINGTLYNTPTTKEALIEAFNPDFRGVTFDIENVPYAQNYEIEVVGRKQTTEEKIFGNFGWTYDPNTNEYSEDDKIPYGNLEFVKAVYNNVTYNTVAEVNAAGNIFEWKDASKDGDPFGEALLPVGTELTVRLIPDKGYQLTELTLNGMPFETGEEPGLYTFTIGGGNWHLGANFTEVDNEVDNTSTSVKAGNIEIDLNDDNSFVNGTAKLEIKDIGSMSPEREEEFVNTAEDEGYEIDSYVDMSLFNTIYKGGKTDANGKIEAWDTKVDNIENDAAITLQLNEDMSNKKIVLVHETHDGDTVTGYEVIDTAYNERDNTITFNTNSFSNYAIAVKDSVKKEYTVEDEQGNSITFKDETGHTYTLTVFDYLSLTDADLEEYGISKEEYDEVFNKIKELTKENGELLAFYQIEVLDENGNPVVNGPLKIKIKMTDEMKKYNTFKIMFIDIDNDFKTEKPITLTQEGDYLVGELDHLSTYALSGSITSNSTIPKTVDNIYMWVGILIASVAGLSLVTYCTVKKIKNN